MSSAGVGSTNGDTELPEWFEDITTDNEDAFKEVRPRNIYYKKIT